MSKIQDTQARQDALDISQSFIVQAPAGSGKTELLIQRFLKLLARVEKPEHILAMTFTRKAAGEMKARIVQALDDALLDQPPEAPHKHLTWELGRDALAQDRKQNWCLLENPARLKVQTIDSFCASLTRQTPLLSGFGSGLHIEENAADLYRETAHQVLNLVEQDTQAGKVARMILERLNNSKENFLERIIQLLQKRDLWMIQFFENSESTPNRKIQEQILASLVQSKLEICARHFTPDLAQQLPAFAAYSAGNLHTENPAHPIACLQNITALPQPDINQLNQWKGIASLLLTKNFEFRKPGGVNKKIGFPSENSHEAISIKDNFKELLNSLSENNELRQALAEIAEAPDPRFNDEDWDFLEALLTLLPEIARTLREVFSSQEKTDFSEISLSARKALGHELAPTDLLLKLDMQLQHILVDEFQDTSYKQIDLLKLLTEGWEPQDGRTLFIVGDPMQSIYRFRDALVELFIKIREEGIGSVHLKKIQLLTNFRSQKQIVDWVNGCFSAILPGKDDPNRGAIAYTRSHAALTATLKPGVVLHPIEDAQSTEEADQVVSTIQKIQSGNSKSSIAILVRGRTHLKKIITGLQNAAIKFRAEEIDPLTSRPAILDLLALMRCFLFPMDRVSWLSVLRAPWCGLSLDDLHVLCASDKDSSVWSLMNQPNRLASLSADGQRRTERLIAILAPALDSMHHHNFGEVLEGCWLELGGPACLDEHSRQDTQVFFDKISELLDAGERETLDHFENFLQRLYANPAVSEDATVQIMTMHKAKGLEFDFVLIPGLGKKSKSSEKQLIFWLPHEENLLLAPISDSGDEDSPIYKFLAGMNKDRENFESRRLLYVSATRAKNQLHLFGHTVTHSDGRRKPQAGSHLDYLWPFVETSWSSPSPPVQPPKQDDTVKPTHQIRRLPADFKTPSPPPAIETGTAIDLSLEEELKPPYEWAGNKARCLGIVLHRYFQEMTRQGLDIWDTKNLESVAPAFQTALLAEGLAPTDLKEALTDGMTALRNILEDAIGRNILGRHEDDHSEYALTQVDGNRFVNKIIDRTYVEDGVRWIIDYKTGKHEGGNLERFFREEKERYQPQLEGYANLIRLTGETRPIKKALYYPMHQRQLEID